MSAGTQAQGDAEALPQGSQTRPGDLVVYTEEWPPVSFSAHGKIDGMAAEVVREMLRRAGQTTEIKLVPWARGFKMVSEVPNVLLFAVARTPERARRMTLIGPLLVARTEIYQKRGSPWLGRTEAELRQALVGTYRAAIFEKVAREHGFSRIELATAPVRSARMLLAGRVDLWIDSNLSAPAIVQAAGGDPDDIERVLTLHAAEQMLAVSSGTPPPIVAALEDALRAMKTDGSYQEIFRRWFPNDTPPRHVLRVGSATQ